MNEETTTALDLAEAERFADALERLEASGEVGLDPREDPTLTALTDLAAGLRGAAERAAAGPRFASYRVRSRASLLHRLAGGSAAPRRAAHAHPLPFPLRWNVLSPIASAAAAAVLVLALVALQRGGSEPAPAPAVAVQPEAAAPPAAPAPDAAPAGPSAGAPPADLPPDPWAIPILEAAAGPSAEAPDGYAAEAPDEETAIGGAPAPFVATPAPGPRTIAQELGRIDGLLAAMTVRVERRQPVSAEALRGITESIAAVAYHIESQPASVQREQVIAYIKAAADSRILLAAAHTDAASGAALSAARRVASDGVAVASWYFTYY